MFDPLHTAEVFSGGACKGFYLTGYMKLKEDLKITDEDLGIKTYKYGVSVGSFISALMAEGIVYDDLDDYFRKNENVMSNIFPVDLFSLFRLHVCHDDENGYKIDFTKKQVANSGFAHINNIERFLKNFMGDVTFKERPELEFTAIDWDKKCPIYINHKTCPDLKVREGCIISAAIPAVYPERKIKHNGVYKYAVDGGIIENLPIKHALQNKKVKDIFAVTFSGLFPEKKHPEAWWDLLLPAMTLCSSYNEINYMTQLLEEDYRDFIIKKGVKKIKYKGRKINLALLYPEVEFKYAFESSYKNFKFLSDLGYSDSEKKLNELYNLKKKNLFFFK